MADANGIVTYVSPQCESVIRHPTTTSSVLTWTLSVEDAQATHYRIFRSRNPEINDPVTIETFSTPEALIEAEATQTILIGTVERGVNTYKDESNRWPVRPTITGWKRFPRAAAVYISTN